MLLTNYRKSFLSQLSIEGTWPAKGSGRAEEGEWGGEEAEAVGGSSRERVKVGL